MKMLIFLIVLALLASFVMWRTRKADAEKELARHQAMKHKQKQRKEAITPVEHAKWPTVIHAAGKPAEKEVEELPELAMTTIEFERVDHPSLQN
jgi:type II secretory pathway pseudopilin PulG